MLTFPGILHPTLAYGMGGSGAGVTFFDPANPSDKPKLANDAIFLAVVSRAMQSSHASPQNYEKVMAALTNGDLSALTLDERAAIVAGASQLRDGYRSNADQAADRLVALIGRSTNNQANTGPGSGQVVTTTPKAGGGQLALTAGELQDNEGFAALALKVFIAAGGSIDQWNNPFSTQMDRGFGGRALFGDKSFGGADMSKWSTEERVSFLKLVADLGSHGRLSGQDQLTLMQAVQQRNNGGGEEASITLPVSGKKVSVDDLMENGTFKKLLSDSVSGPFGGRSTQAGVNVLADLIATADYSQLSLDERSALLTAIDRALDHRNGGLTSDKAAKIVQMFKGFLVPDSSLCEPPPGHTLSNGLTVSDASLASPGNFGSLVQQTLQRSGMASGRDSPGANPGFWQTHQASMLMALDVSSLSPDQRLKLLEKIATASRDKVIDSAEMRDIMNSVGTRYGVFV
jgi:hypothetical protein